MKRSILAVFATALAASNLAACGTITQGTTQDIAITTTPPGAHCDLTRKGRLVATVDKTPNTVTVDKTKNDIHMTCALPGYRDASAKLESGYGIGTFGNIIFGGAVGWAIDSATGADNKYPSSAMVNFIPLAPPSMASAAAPAATPAPPSSGFYRSEADAQPNVSGDNAHVWNDGYGRRHLYAATSDLYAAPPARMDPWHGYGDGN